jgi:hypothetical protein
MLMKSHHHGERAQGPAARVAMGETVILTESDSNNSKITV